MARAEPFARAKNGRERLAHRLGPVKDIRGAVAEVAFAAALGLFPEVFQQGGAAAVQRLGQAQKRVQPAMVGHAAFGRGQAFVDLRPAQADVIRAEQGQRLGRGPVAAGAADFLVIGLDRLGQIGVGDPTDVRLVDTHAKGHGGHDDQPVLLLEALFGQAAVIGLHAAVIVDRGMPGLAQGLRQGLGLGAGAAIDDARLAFAGGGKVQDLAARTVLGGKGQVDIGPIEPAQELLRRAGAEQTLDDLGPGFRIRRGGKGGDRHVQRGAQFPDPQVIGAEIMAPLADTMGLVHGDQRHADPLQHVARPDRGQAFRRKIQ